MTSKPIIVESKENGVEPTWINGKNIGFRDWKKKVFLKTIKKSNQYFWSINGYGIDSKVLDWLVQRNWNIEINDRLHNRKIKCAAQFFKDNAEIKDYGYRKQYFIQYDRLRHIYNV